MHHAICQEETPRGGARSLRSSRDKERNLPPGHLAILLFHAGNRSGETNRSSNEKLKELSVLVWGDIQTGVEGAFFGIVESVIFEGSGISSLLVLFVRLRFGECPHET
jgi:hypothetical protein